MSSFSDSKHRHGEWHRCFEGSIVAVLILTSGGCASPRYRTVALTPGVSTMLTEADTRMISLRPNPKGEGKPKILCAEPSPDVAKALSLAMQAEAKVATPGDTSVGAGAGYASSEALMTLAGRTTTVVALRDGLYRACEAYANGIIGRSAYAMILSQYGDLLVTLMLGEAAAGATVPNGTTIQANNPTITIDSSAPPAAKKKAGKDGSTDADAVEEGAKEETAFQSESDPRNEVSWPEQPMLMSAAIFKEASSPSAKNPSAASGTSPAPADAPAPVPAASQSETGDADGGDAAAVARVAELYWKNIGARSRRSNFVTCVSTAETPPEESSELQISLRRMCEGIFDATLAESAPATPK